MRKVAIITLAAMTISGCAANPMAAVFAGQAEPNAKSQEADRRTITVSGEGVVRVAPDTATTTVAVEAQAREASAAQVQVNNLGNRIIAAWRNQGVPESDIQTVGLDLHPEYARPERTDKPELVAYRATLRLQVRSRPGEAGDRVDAALRNGANRLEGVAFSREALGEPRKEAIQKAINQAMEEARAALSPLALSLDEVREIQVGQSYLPPPMPFGGAPMMARMEADLSTPVRPGEVEVRAQVTVKASF